MLSKGFFFCYTFNAIEKWFYLLSTRTELSLIFSDFLFRYFPLTNPHVTTAMLGFFKKNYRKNKFPEILNIILSGYLNLIIESIEGENLWFSGNLKSIPI